MGDYEDDVEEDGFEVLVAWIEFVEGSRRRWIEWDDYRGNTSCQWPDKGYAEEEYDVLEGQEEGARSVWEGLSNAGNHGDNLVIELPTRVLLGISESH